ncbi:uncharacterized protein PHALS_10105 [Plasmopara halstedii]|uniref:Uncharacterized protein n=1 Tax=Plasmopara halstedii TaxID=4781 RepID=A0A0P1AGA9_PLAHL|nr:uncharacterized protein PHALS_10105 [Plasmopara halstedii]CEG39877.1 hypothetical protein PHALS_10105 [Plasmopara halstedii]|eukprot:XP_024576246.1 hypothetical protein PHALS_10105 [Plasmopara halstedii]
MLKQTSNYEPCGVPNRKVGFHSFVGKYASSMKVKDEDASIRNQPRNLKLL